MKENVIHKLDRTQRQLSAISLLKINKQTLPLYSISMFLDKNKRNVKYNSVSISRFIFVISS